MSDDDKELELIKLQVNSLQSQAKAIKEKKGKGVK